MTNLQCAKALEWRHVLIYIITKTTPGCEYSKFPLFIQNGLFFAFAIESVHERVGFDKKEVFDGSSREAKNRGNREAGRKFGMAAALFRLQYTLKQLNLIFENLVILKVFFLWFELKSVWCVILWVVLH